MKRHPAFVALSQEHHDGLLLATRLQQGTNALLRLWSHDLHWQSDYVVKIFDENLRLPVEEKLQNLLTQFGKILETHIRIEEREFFPLCEEHIPDEQLQTMGKRINESLE